MSNTHVVEGCQTAPDFTVDKVISVKRQVQPAPKWFILIDL